MNTRLRDGQITRLLNRRAIVNEFEPNTDYLIDTLILYQNDLYRAAADFTSGAAFNPSDWVQLDVASNNNLFITSDTLSPTMGGTATIQVVNLTPLIVGTIPNIRDTIISSDGTINARVTAVDTINQILTVMTIYISSSGTFGGLGGSPYDSTLLAAALNSKLNTDFIDQIVQDVQIDTTTNGFSVKSILADPSNPATVNWITKETNFTTNGVIEINSTGSEGSGDLEISFDINDLDGGMFTN